MIGRRDRRGPDGQRDRPCRALAGLDVMLERCVGGCAEIGDGDHRRQYVAPGRQEDHYRGCDEAGAGADHYRTDTLDDWPTAIW